MVSPIPGSLSKSNEETVRKIFKTIRATKFEDPVDQDSFLVDSANTVLQLQFRPQIASFALVPELGECIFTIRSMMHANNARLGTPFSDAFISIQDFAGEIVRKRQMFRERRRAHIDRMRAAGGAAARIERNAALEYAANTDHKSPHSPGEDVVSIPSSGDESGADEPVPIPKNPPSSPITVDLTNIPPSSQVCPATLLSPIDELGFHLSRMSLNTYPNLLPHSPLSPSHSLPDLVPDFTLGQHRLPAKGAGWKRGRTTTRKQRNFSTPAPVVQCNTLQMIPRPFGPPLPLARPNFVADWLLSRPKFVGSPAPKKSYTGSSKRSVNPNHAKQRSSRK
ncbi:hypothetical protein K438DRAFT_1935576 [Mycena galopus ATCC 62051]|nr:hypothetical protein K438DRAFT_1935576 [Mycena galopus ATCC 62051]